MILLLLCSCGTSITADEFREKSKNCVEKDETILLELFNMHQDHTIEGISQVETENTIKYRYNGIDYFIGIENSKIDDTSTAKYERACEIFDHLIKTYSIKSINYYEDISEFEVWFDENLVDANYGIIYYTDGRELSEETDDKEYVEKIKNGFYYYIMFIGF